MLTPAFHPPPLRPAPRGPFRQLACWAAVLLAAGTASAQAPPPEDPFGPWPAPPEHQQLARLERLPGVAEEEPGGPFLDAVVVEEPQPSLVAHRWVSAAWLAPGGGGFGTTDFDFNVAVEFAAPEGWGTWTAAPGFGMHLWDGPDELDLPPQVYDAYLDLTWRAYECEGFAISAGFTPGVYGDFENIDSKAWQFTGWMLAEWALSPRWIVLAGVAYVRQRRDDVLPVGGVLWIPSEDFRVELLIPKPRVARRLSCEPGKELWAYVAGEFGGGSWAVEQPGGENIIVRYSDLRVLVGLEWLREGGTRMLEAGWVFERDIGALNLSLLRPESTFMLRGGWGW